MAYIPPKEWERLLKRVLAIEPDGRLVVKLDPTNSLIPAADASYDLGSATYRYRDLYLSDAIREVKKVTIKDTDPTPVGDVLLKVIDQELRLRNPADTAFTQLALGSIPRGVKEETASYVIFKEAGVYYAKNGSTGAIDYSGTDAATVIQSAIDALSEYTWDTITGKRGLIVIKDGTYEITSTILVYPTMALIGAGSWGNPILKLADGANVDLIEVKPYTGGAEGCVHIANLTLDGNKANNPTAGRGIFCNGVRDSIIENVKILRSRGYGLHLSNCLNIRALKFTIEESASAGFVISGGTGNYLGYGYVYDNALSNSINGGAEYCKLLFTHISSTGRHGVTLNNAPRGVVAYCHFIDNSKETANSWDGIMLYDTVRDVIVGNIIRNTLTPPNQRYGVKEGGASDYNLIIGNIIENMATGAIDTIGANTEVRHIQGYVTENEGVATFSGDGSTTVFNIPHGLPSTPTKYGVSPLTPDADADRTITADATNIIVTFSAAPPAGTNNVKFGWWAKL